MDYRRNRLYFFPVKKKGNEIPICLCIAGPFAIFFGAFLGKYWDKDWLIMGILCGVSCIIVGVVVIISNVNSNKNISNEAISDYEIDEICARHLETLKENALRKLGINEEEVKESPPIQFNGYYYGSVASTNATVKRGNDGRFRSSNYNAVIFLFSAEQVHCYEYRFSLINDKTEETTDEYFYGDIVSVSTKTETEKVGYTSVNYEKFSLTTSGGTSIGASLLDKGNVEQSIQTMKSLLRNKKQQTQKL